MVALRSKLINRMLTPELSGHLRMRNNVDHIEISVERAIFTKTEMFVIRR